MNTIIIIIILPVLFLLFTTTTTSFTSAFHQCTEDCDERSIAVGPSTDFLNKHTPRDQESNCDFGKFLICHRLPMPGQKTRPVELCVSGKSLVHHLHKHPRDTRGPCPPKPPHRKPCPDSCDDRCPSACGRQNITGPGASEDGFDCWDLNRNRMCDLPEEDMNDDQMCDVLDCQGAPGTNGTNGRDGNDGVRCWDLNSNGMCDVGEEDMNGDGNCTLDDCRGPDANCTCEDPPLNCTCPGTVKLCCYIALSGTFPPQVVPPGPLLGQTRWFAFKDCLQDLRAHAPCQGALLSISQSTSLFALLQTKYGGDGRTSFGLPNFNGMKTWQYMM